MGGTQTMSELGPTFHIVQHDSITNEESDALLQKVTETAKRLQVDFNLQNDQAYSIHIWKDYEAYLSAQEENIGARYDGSAGYIFGQNEMALYYNDKMLENAEHEFAHIASLHLNPEFGNNPRWMWEAVAIYESGEFTHPRDIDYLSQRNFPTLSELNGMLSSEGINKIYQTGYLLSEFIIETWGRNTYLELIQHSEHWTQHLGVTVEDFEKQWYEFITKRYLD